MNKEIEAEQLLKDSIDVESIKKVAREVASKREQYSGKIHEYHEKISKFEQPLNEALSKIKDGLSSFHSNPSSIDSSVAIEAMEKCDELINLVASCKKQVAILDTRFSEKKIRISSVGPARAGKSTFTQLYSGLPENLVKTKEGSEDYTGAICNYINDSNLQKGQFVAEISFLSEHEILKSINGLLKLAVDKARSNGELNGVSLSIPEKFNSKSEVINCIGRAIEIPGVENVSMLEKYLSEGVRYWEYAGHAPITISNINNKGIFAENIDEYNLLDSKEKKCFAVREVNIYANLGSDGLFDDFIVGDTMGISEHVGKAAEDSVDKAMEDSDAVFSIHLTQQQPKYYFYDTFLRNRKSNNALLAKKHYIIVNCDEGMDSESVKGQVSKVRKTETSDCIYVGSLKSKNNPDMPEKFAKSVVRDMLGKIANHIREFDEERVEKCNRSVEKIKETLQDLRVLLNNLELVDEFNCRNEVHKFYSIMLEPILKEIHLKMQDAEDLKGEDDYDAFRSSKDSKFPSAYEIITGRTPWNENTKGSTSASSRVVDIMDDVESAVKERYEGLVEKANESRYYGGSDMVFCGWLQIVLPEFFTKMSEGMTNVEKQLPTIIQKEKDYLFNFIFDKLELREDVRDEGNPYVSALMDIYQREYKGNITKLPLDKYVYSTLKKYFEEHSLEDEVLSDSLSVIDTNELLEILQESIVALNIPDWLHKLYTEKYNALCSFYTDVDNFINKRNYENDYVDILVNHLELLPNNEMLIEKQRRSEADKGIKENRELLSRVVDGFNQLGPLSL